MSRCKDIMDNLIEEKSDKAAYKKAKSKLISIPVISDSSQIMSIVRDAVGEDKELMKHLSTMTTAFSDAFDHLAKKSK